MEYKIKGDVSPMIRFSLAAGEHVHVQSDAYMSSGVDVKAEKLVGSAGLIRRYLSGDAITWNYQNLAKDEQTLSVSTKNAGFITAVECANYDGALLVNNGAFFAMVGGLSAINVVSTKRLRKSGVLAAVFSQGVTMQKLEPLESEIERTKADIKSDYVLFLESKGKLDTHVLDEGQKLRVNKKALFGLSENIDVSLKPVEKNRLRHFLSGEGFSVYEMSGPGIVITEAHGKPANKKGPVYIAGAVMAGFLAFSMQLISDYEIFKTALLGDKDKANNELKEQFIDALFDAAQKGTLTLNAQPSNDITYTPPPLP